jgi:hypothetical protein
MARHPQECQMIYFQTQNSNLGKFCRLFQWKMFVYFWTFGLPYCHFIFFVAILVPFGIFFPFWYVVPRKIWQPWASIGWFVFVETVLPRRRAFFCSKPASLMRELAVGSLHGAPLYLT